MTPEETNIACAERLKLGSFSEKSLRRQTRKGNEDPKGVVVAYKQCEGGGWYSWEPIPNFCGSMDAAIRLVNKAKEKGWDCRMSNVLHHNLWSVTMCSGTGHGFSQTYAQAATLPAAICEAFLKLPA